MKNTIDRMLPRFNWEEMTYKSAYENQKSYNPLNKGNNHFLNNIQPNKKLSFVQNTNDVLVELTKSNANLVKNMINSNSSYNGRLAEKMYEYHCLKNGGTFPNADVDAITDVIRMIDLENNTYVWRYNRQHILDMAQYISNPKTKFWIRLHGQDKNLVEDLKNQNNVSQTSLPSKICKYLAMYAFPGSKIEYYIFDSVVRKALPYYLYQNNLISSFKTYDSYTELWDDLEALRKTTNLSKDELDRLLWYCYRT